MKKIQRKSPWLACVTLLSLLVLGCDPLNELPPLPSIAGLSAEPFEGGVKLSWSPLPDTSGVESIEMSWETRSTSVSPLDTFAEIYLAAVKEYIFTVRVKGLYNTYSEGLKVSAIPVFNTATLPPINGFRVMPIKEGAILSWTKITDTLVKSIIRTDGTTEKVLSANATSDTVRGLTAGKEVTFTLYTADEDNNKSKGSSLAVTPYSEAQAAQVSTLPIVTNFAVVAGNEKVYLSWDNTSLVGDATVDKIKVTYLLGGTESSKLIDLTETSDTIDRLIASSEYTFTVQTQGTDGTFSAKQTTKSTPYKITVPTFTVTWDGATIASDITDLHDKVSEVYLTGNLVDVSFSSYRESLLPQKGEQQRLLSLNSQSLNNRQDFILVVKDQHGDSIVSNSVTSTSPFNLGNAELQNYVEGKIGFNLNKQNETNITSLTLDNNLPAPDKISGLTKLTNLNTIILDTLTDPMLLGKINELLPGFTSLTGVKLRGYTDLSSFQNLNALTDLIAATYGVPSFFPEFVPFSDPAIPNPVAPVFDYVNSAIDMKLEGAGIPESSRAVWGTDQSVFTEDVQNGEIEVKAIVTGVTGGITSMNFNKFFLNAWVPIPQSNTLNAVNNAQFTLWNGNADDWGVPIGRNQVLPLAFDGDNTVRGSSLDISNDTVTYTIDASREGYTNTGTGMNRVHFDEGVVTTANKGTNGYLLFFIAGGTANTDQYAVKVISLKIRGKSQWFTLDMQEK